MAIVNASILPFCLDAPLIYPLPSAQLLPGPTLQHPGKQSPSVRPSSNLCTRPNYGPCCPNVGSSSHSPAAVTLSTSLPLGQPHFPLQRRDLPHSSHQPPLNLPPALILATEAASLNPDSSPTTLHSTPWPNFYSASALSHRLSNGSITFASPRGIRIQSD